MDDWKVAIPYELAVRIARYCKTQLTCHYCVLRKDGKTCGFEPYHWDISAMTVEDDNENLHSR